MAVNVDANLSVLRASTAELLARAPRGGRVVVNASKNVHAPGPGRGRVLGVEGVAHPAGARGRARVGANAASGSTSSIRTRSSTPGSGTSETLRTRAASYGSDGRGVQAEQLARRRGDESLTSPRSIVALCSPTFAKTTGAQIPIDGGNERIV